eukprot:3260943-Pyramimonas_sp.AAC.2
MTVATGGAPVAPLVQHLPMHCNARDIYFPDMLSNGSGTSEPASSNGGGSITREVRVRSIRIRGGTIARADSA